MCRSCRLPSNIDPQVYRDYVREERASEQDASLGHSVRVPRRGTPGPNLPELKRQEVRKRLVRAATEGDVALLATLLKEAKEAHTNSGDSDAGWPGWYAKYLLGVI